MPWSWRTTPEVVDRFPNRFQNRSLEQKGNEDCQENQMEDLSRFHARNVITFRLRTGMSRLRNSKHSFFTSSGRWRGEDFQRADPGNICQDQYRPYCD
jgi:hypothetical protein